MDRIAIIIGRESFLLHGDAEANDDRFIDFDDNGNSRGIAIPVLIKEGWKIKRMIASQNEGITLLTDEEEDQSENKKHEK